MTLETKQDRGNKWSAEERALMLQAAAALILAAYGDTVNTIDARIFSKNPASSKGDASYRLIQNVLAFMRRRRA